MSATFTPCEPDCATYLYPCASDGDDSRPYVERCDMCDRFADDREAAAHVAAEVGGLIVLAPLHDDMGHGENTWGHVRWQPAVYPWPKEATT